MIQEGWGDRVHGGIKLKEPGLCLEVKKGGKSVGEGWTSKEVVFRRGGQLWKHRVPQSGFQSSKKQKTQDTLWEYEQEAPQVVITVAHQLKLPQCNSEGTSKKKVRIGGSAAMARAFQTSAGPTVSRLLMQQAQRPRSKGCDHAAVRVEHREFGAGAA